jgi:hypothetical protein
MTIVTSQCHVQRTPTRTAAKRPRSTIHAPEHLRSKIMTGSLPIMDPRNVGSNPIARRMSSMLMSGERHRSRHARQTPGVKSERPFPFPALLRRFDRDMEPVGIGMASNRFLKFRNTSGRGGPRSSTGWLRRSVPPNPSRLAGRSSSIKRRIDTHFVEKRVRDRPS